MKIKKITTEEYKNMLDITTTLEEYVCKHIDDISESGADSMLQEKVAFYFDKARKILHLWILQRPNSTLTPPC